MRLSFRKRAGVALIWAALVALPGCTAFVADSSFFQGPDVNLLAVDYGAADMLAHRAKGVLKPGTPVRVGILVDAYTTNAAHPAKAGSDNMGGAMGGDHMGVPVTPVAAQNLTPDSSMPVAMGHSATASDTMPPMPAAVAIPPTPVVHIPGPFGKVVIEQIAGRWVDLGFHVVGGSGLARAGQAILGGQYARADGKVLINLRLKDAASGRILAVYDYSIPINREINDLLGDDGQAKGLFKW
jgi:hypothetical protein